MFPVYLITCHHPSYGRYIMPYVGCCPSGKSIAERFAEHLKGRGSAPYLYNAIQKHGKEHFHIEQIDAGNTPEQALELERWWIARLKTKAPEGGYNLTDGGEGVVNPPAYIRDAYRKAGRIQGPIQGRKNVENGHFKRITSRETCAKGGSKSCHVHWHVKRNITNPVCPLCKKSTIRTIKQT